MSQESLTPEKACQYVIESLKKQALQGEVILDRGSDFSLQAQGRKLSEVSASSSQVIGLRLISGHKAAVTSSESFTPESLAQMIEDAVSLARLSKEAPENELMAIKTNPTWDSALTSPADKASLEQKTQLALNLESAVLDKSQKVKACPYNGYSEGEYERILASTEGLWTQLKTKSKNCYTSALIEDSGDQAMSYWSSKARTFKELNPTECIDKSFSRAQALIGARPLKSGKYDIVFETDIHQSFWSMFSNIFSAKAVLQGQNPLAQKMGQRVASSSLTILDRPLLSEGLRTRYFDDEGGVCEDVALIKEGVLSNFLHNHQTALKLKVQNNYRAARGAKGHLDVGHTHFCISKGSGSEKEILSGKEVLLITSIQGLYSGSSDISGDFSCGASGLLYSEGVAIRSFKGITLSGNWWDMLGKQLLLVGEKVEASTSKSFFSPLIRWSGVQVAGE